MELAEFINKSISEYSKYIFSEIFTFFLNLKILSKNINLDDINYIDEKIINLLLKKLIRKILLDKLDLINKIIYNN